MVEVCMSCYVLNWFLLCSFFCFLLFLCVTVLFIFQAMEAMMIIMAIMMAMDLVPIDLEEVR